MTGWKEGVAVFAGFCALTAILTYPLILHLATAVTNPGDPLFNSWTLAWGVQALLTDPLRLFDANIFYPHARTLAYSDHLVGSALLAAPVFLATGNALLAHNVVLFLSFSLSGLGMYYLARHLTGHRGASLIAGLIFAFAPYRFGHLSHLPLLTAQWMPLTLLFLHRALAGGGRWRDVLAFGGFFTLQGLSGGYYTYYLALTVTYLLGVSLWVRGRPVWRIVPRLAIVGGGAGLVLLPFLLPYVAVRQVFGFVRPLDEVLTFAARPESYLAAPTSNWLYGAVTEPFRQPEGVLFLGFVPVLLALYGLGARSPAAAELDRPAPVLTAPADPPSPGGSRRRLAAGLEGIVLLSLAVAVVGCLVGLRVDLGPLRLSGLWRPLAVAAAAYGVRWLLLGRHEPLRSLDPVRRRLGRGSWPLVYAGLGILAGLFSLGPLYRTAEGGRGLWPYLCLYRELPGFDGLRVPARFAILVVLAVAVLAAFGVARLPGRVRHQAWGRGISGVLAAAILIEFVTVLGPLTPVPAETPEVYQWLAGQPGDFAIVELPFPSPTQAHYEARRLYYSTVHWKRLVNGYSGHFPPDYWEQADRLRAFPGPEAVALLRDLGVRYVLLHARPNRAWWEEQMTALERPPDDLAIAARFPDALVVELRLSGPDGSGTGR